MTTRSLSFAKSVEGLRYWIYVHNTRMDVVIGFITHFFFPFAVSRILYPVSSSVIDDDALGFVYPRVLEAFIDSFWFGACVCEEAL